MTNEEIHEVFRKIAAGERRHGSFLTAFAEAFMAADPSNEDILRPAARVLIAKYPQLEGYASDSCVRTKI